MVARKDVATVNLWGENVGAIVWNREREIGIFEFEPAFLKKNQISPFLIPESDPGIISYPVLNKDTIKDYPDLLQIHFQMLLETQ